jgi:endoribonuclease Nob1
MNIEKSTMGKRVMVLDTSAFVGGFDPFTVREDQVAPPMVEEEVKRNAMTLLRFSTAVESGRLKIFAPSQEFINKVKASATSVGDSFFLSETDKQVLALALEIRARGDDPQIVTDDYSIQNVAKQLGLGYISLVTFGIKRLLTWIRYCPACHRTYPANFKATECPICGTALKRKPQRNAPKPATKSA